MCDATIASFANRTCRVSLLNSLRMQHVREKSRVGDARRTVWDNDVKLRDDERISTEALYFQEEQWVTPNVEIRRHFFVFFPILARVNQRRLFASLEISMTRLAFESRVLLSSKSRDRVVFLRAKSRATNSEMNRVLYPSVLFVYSVCRAGCEKLTTRVKTVH